MKRRRLARKGDKGTWTNRREKTRIRITEDQELGDNTVTVAPEKAPGDAGKTVPAKEVTLDA